MSLCVLTNNAAVFPPAIMSGGNLIRCMELDFNTNGVILPGVDEISRVFNELERDFSAILLLTASENILPGAKAARSAAQNHGGIAKISVMDTQQIGAGLGILAQIAAHHAAGGVPIAAVEAHLRSIIPRLFTLLCPDHPPRYQIGTNPANPEFMDEQTGIQRVYSIEEGRLVSYKKVRTQRHLLESMHEFLEEFEKPQEVVFFHGNNNNLRARPLRETSGNLFPASHFAELEINSALTALFGSQTVGLTVLDA